MKAWGWGWLGALVSRRATSTSVGRHRHPRRIRRVGMTYDEKYWGELRNAARPVPFVDDLHHPSCPARYGAGPCAGCPESVKPALTVVPPVEPARDGESDGS